MDRRQFIQRLAISAAALPVLSGRPSPSMADTDALGKTLPRRPLGVTGEWVTCLGLGGFHINATTEILAQTTIEAALEEGIRFFDTAESYGPHTSELRFGQFLVPRYRDHIFVMTKSAAKTADEARAHLQGSLRRLRTDRIDLWQIHSLASPQDVDARIKGGVLDMALRAREEGKIRHIGFTGHADPAAFTRMLERTADLEEPFAAYQCPVNPVDAASKHSFINTLFPKLPQRPLGVLAMKTLADGRFFRKKVRGERTVWTSEDPVIPNALEVSDCIHFALSLPISVIITGAEKPEFVRDKAAMVRSFTSLDAEQRESLMHRVARFAEAGQVEFYKARSLRG